jgi:dihydrofolate reductase
MGKVLIDICVSLDGIIRASGATPDAPLGVGGEQLHQWLFDGPSDAENSLFQEAVDDEGAIICGRRTYDDSIRWWGADGPVREKRTPVVVVTHTPPESVPPNSVYTFASSIEEAVAAAKTIAAARGKGIIGVGGGASVIRQLIAKDLADGVSLHVVPVLLGSGLRLFDDNTTVQRRLKQTSCLVGKSVTHLRYDLVREMAAAQAAA